MMTERANYWVATAVGSVAFGCAVIGSLLFAGDMERLITRAAGVVLVIVAAVSGRMERGKEVAEGVGGRLQDAISAIGILSAMLLGYLIYFTKYNLPNRRTYIASAAIAILLVFAVSYVPPYLKARRRARGA